MKIIIDTDPPVRFKRYQSTPEEVERMRRANLQQEERDRQAKIKALKNHDNRNKI